jgi:integrase
LYATQKLTSNLSVIKNCIQTFLELIMLTIIEVRAAQPKNKNYLLNDGSGLFLRVEPSGAKRWVLNRSIKGQHISKVLGIFPDMTLKDARLEAQRLSVELRALKVTKAVDFLSVYKEWLALKKTQIKNWVDIDRRFNKYLLPRFSSVAFKEITPTALIEELKSDLGQRAKLETLKRICGELRSLETFAYNSGLIDLLRWQNLAAVFPSPSNKRKNRPSVGYSELPEVLCKLKAEGIKSHTTWSVLLCGFYTLLRPGEYTAMRWDWIDFKDKTITIPAEIMKMKREHVVPMSRQLIALLEDLPRTSDYVFPSPQRNGDRPVSTNSASQFLRRNGFADVLVPHGIRAIGRSWMFDNKVPFEVAELCLAHSVGSSTVQAYVRSDRLEERREVMQRWCDYVEVCMKGGADLLL